MAAPRATRRAKWPVRSVAAAAAAGGAASGAMAGRSGAAAPKTPELGGQKDLCLAGRPIRRGGVAGRADRRALVERKRAAAALAARAPRARGAAPGADPAAAGA